VTIGQRFARIATEFVVRRPALWRVFRPLLRSQFDKLAPRWDALRRPDSYASLEAALDLLPAPPRRALDIGTGTGAAARLVAARFPKAEVTGVDVAPKMVEQARRLKDAPHVRFEVADAEKLPAADGTFDLVTLANAIPFFDELARVTAPGGRVVFSFSAGPETPIYVPSERLRSELERRGFADFAELSAARGTAFVAAKR
jgi:ubiquinone/menaquinone biosynthesis C-methylase UbiE